MSTMLIINDDPRLQKLIGTLLNSRGHCTLEAGCGEEAKQILSHCQIDLIVIEYNLPDTDGRSWVNWLRDNGKSVPVVLLTGSNNDELVIEDILIKLQSPSIVGSRLEPRLLFSLEHTILSTMTIAVNEMRDSSIVR